MSETVAIKEHNHRFYLHDADGFLVGKANPGKKVLLADAFYVPQRTRKRRNRDTDNYYMGCCSCSRCNAGWFEDIYDKPFSYCPHCGAKVVV